MLTAQIELADELTDAATRRETSVLATVVRVVGSAYRGVGARMLVRADDSTIGLVSGGCLEGDLVTRARFLRASMEPMLVTYDTRSGDDLVWGLGLGCEGLVQVLLEPVDPERSLSLASLMRRARQSAAASVIATIFGADLPSLVGSRVLIDQSGAFDVLGFDAIDSIVLDRIREDAHELLESTTGAMRGTTRRYALTDEQGGIEVAFELVVPPIHLLICGAGPDAIPLVRLASSLGWQVTVVDHRLSPRHAERFPETPVVVGEPAAVVSSSANAGRTHAVVMSHHFERDLSYLHALLESDIRYIGLLGPRQRTERLIAERVARFAPLSDEMHGRIFGPVGLDLGGDGPEAVALAIVGEVLALSTGRTGGHLRDRSAPIHEAQQELGVPLP